MIKRIQDHLIEIRIMYLRPSATTPHSFYCFIIQNRFDLRYLSLSQSGYREYEQVEQSRTNLAFK